MIEQLILLSENEVIEPDQFMATLGVKGTDRKPETPGFVIPPQGICLESVERDFVLQALKQTSWNLSQAAKLPGLSRDTLRYRVEKYELNSLSKS